MLKLRHSSPVTRSMRIPDDGRMGVAWLQGEMAVVVPGRDGNESAWVSTEPVLDPAMLGAALREAVLRTGFKGRTACLTLAHARLVQRRVEMPPMRGTTRRQFLQRQAEQTPGLDGPLIWVCRPAVPSSGTEAVILHLISRHLHDELVAAFRSAGLDLTLLVPVGELLVESVPSEGFAAEACVLVATTLSSTLEVAVIRGDGVPLINRTAITVRSGDPLRVGDELFRTLQFVEQAFSWRVETLWWLGLLSEPSLETVLPSLRDRIRNAPGEFDTLHWARRAATRAEGRAVSLITPEQHEAAGRRALRSFHGVASVAGLLASVFFCVFVESYRHRQLRSIGQLRQASIRLEARRIAIEPRVAVIRKQRALIDIAGSDPSAPVPLWLVGFLNVNAPENLRLTNVTVHAVADTWKFGVGGLCSLDSERSVCLSGLSNLLSGSPFFATCQSGSTEASTAAPPTTWTTRLRDFKGEPRTDSQSVSIEGTLQ